MERRSGAAGPKRQWLAIDRLVLLLIVPVFVLSTPGFGPENREFSNGGIPAILTTLLVGPLASALLLSWKAPTAAAIMGSIGSAVLGAVIIADLLGLLVGKPPTGMYLVDALMLAVAAAIAWRCIPIARA